MIHDNQLEKYCRLHINISFMTNQYELNFGSMTFFGYVQKYVIHYLRKNIDGTTFGRSSDPLGAI